MSCGCCEPATVLTPLEVDNRAGETVLAYRVGTYASFRATMLERISRDRRLDGLTTREDDDAAITVLSLWAAVADVLTFYQERYVTEAFLRTATQRASVGRLAALVDYRLRPGVAALAWLAFGVEDGRRLRVPRGLRVQSVPGQDEQPQTFETLDELHALAALSRRRVLPPPYGASPLRARATEALVDPGPAGAAALALVARDRLLLYETGSAGRAEQLTVAELRLEDDRATLAWETPLRADWPDGAGAAKAGRTFRLFGATAPRSAMTPVSDPKLPGGIGWTLGTTSFSRDKSSTLPLDARVEGIGAGTRLLVDDAAGATTLVTVAAVDTAAQELGGVSDSVTVLRVTPPLPATSDRRAVAVHELTGPEIAFWRHAYPRRLTGATVVLGGVRRDDGTIEVGRTPAAGGHQPGVRLRAADVEPGRTVLVGDAETDPVPAVVVRAQAVGATISTAPTAADATSILVLGLDAKAALARSGVVSAPLPFRVVPRAPRPELRVRIGALSPRTLRLGPVTSTPGADLAALRAALHAAGAERELAQATVVRSGRHIIALAGGEDAPPVVFGPTERDATTVLDLGLDAEHARPIQALQAGPVALPLALTAAAPELAVTIGPIGPVTVSLGVVDGQSTAAVLAAALAAAIRAADDAPGFREARVLAVAGGRLLLLPGPFGSVPADFLRIDLSTEEPLDLDAETAFLLGNAAAASHGETVRGEPLGGGDASQSFQRLTLRRRPLTYVPRARTGGTTSSLQLLVGGVRWDEVPTLHGRPPTAQVFETRTEDDGTTVLRFGDGREAGAPLPTGTANVSATYRHGAGVAGRVRAGTLSTALDRPVGLRDVTNPRPATGGADPEAIEAARENAPSTVRTFGRAVSLTDVADLVRASGEVAKAQAVSLWDGLDRAVHVTVAGQAAGVFATADLRRLTAALQAARDPGSRVALDNFSPLPVVLRGAIAVDARHVRADVLAAVDAAVRDALSFDAARLGTPLQLSDLYRVVHDVPGVLAADIDELQAKKPADRERPGADRLPDGTPAPVQAHLQVQRARVGVGIGHVLPAELAVVESPARDVTLSATGGLDA